MKTIQRNQNSLKTHGIQKTVKFGIKASGLAHIFNVLRNQLYSDKIMAVVREYTCNAVDAHIEDGNSDRPIVVTLPTQLLPEFKVRDFGKALTDAEIADVYAFYGESTKRQSNEMIGQLGLGSKSAFAYGDNFVINSFINGTKCIYNAFIDPSQIGQISKIGVEDTDEENGIEIIVPVRDDDHTEFEEKAYSLFRYFLSGR
jgi:HSP90 family molecular chaperone